MTYAEAIRAALVDEMDRDERVVLLGEDIAHYGGAFRVTRDLADRFGPERVITAATLADAIETATAVVEDAGGDADGAAGMSGAGIVITGSVVTAGAARTLFGKDPA